METKEKCKVCGEQLSVTTISYYPPMYGTSCPNGCDEEGQDMSKKEDNKKIAMMTGGMGKVVVSGGVGASGKVEIVTEVMKDLKKPGMVIAVYPGMGTEIFCDIYDNYYYLESEEYYREDPERVTPEGLIYAEDAIAKVQMGDYDICFVDAHTNVIKYLDELDQTFIIFYPADSKEKIMQRIANIYAKRQTMHLAQTLSYVVKNHEKAIEELRLYNNSIMSSTGILNEDLLKDLVKMTPNERRQVIQTFEVMKTTKKE